MRIEEESPKNYFRNPGHKTIVNILFTSNWIAERLKEILQVEDITYQQYNILRILENSKKPLSTLQIREQMLDRMSDTSRIVERLLKKKLVDKDRRPSDKRLVDVILSEKGKDLLLRMQDKVHIIDSISSALQDDEMETLNNLLDKLREYKG